MAAPQGLIEFPSVEHFNSGSVTITHGITPSIITLRCAAQLGPFLSRGPVLITYGSVSIMLPNCLLDLVDYTVDEEGKQWSTFTLLDRRWRWKGFGWIAGEYNVRRSDKPNTLVNEKTPQELAKLCFEALWEKKFNVSQLPNKTRPYVDWDGTPAEYLAQLCDSLGCRIAYDVLSDSFRVVQAGVGKQLPNLLTHTAASLSINPPEVPDKIIYRAGKTLYESLLELEFIGEEPDGELKDINKLSYKPANGWDSSFPPEWSDVKKEYRELARNCIYRLFRIKTPVVTWGKGKGKGQIDLDHILPLESTRLVTKKMFAKKKILDGEERIPAMLVGEWYGGSELDTPEIKTLQTPLGKYSVYQRGFSVDTDRGLVRTSAPAFLYDGTDPLVRKIKNPKLYLWIAHGIRDPNTRAFFRYEKSYAPPGPKLGTPPLVIDRRDMELRHWFEATAGGAPKSVDNQKEVDQHAQYYINEYLKALQLSNPGSGSWAGIVPIATDGAINSVTWTVSPTGFATTSASRNQERTGTEITYKETRFLQTLQAIQKEQTAKKTEQKKQA